MCRIKHTPGKLGFPETRPSTQLRGLERPRENRAGVQGERSFTLSVLLWGYQGFWPVIVLRLLSGILWLWLGGVGSGEMGKLDF